MRRTKSACWSGSTHRPGRLRARAAFASSLAILVALSGCSGGDQLPSPVGGDPSRTENIPEVLRSIYAPDIELLGDWAIAWTRGYVNGHLELRPLGAELYALDCTTTSDTGVTLQHATMRWTDGALRLESGPDPVRKGVSFPEVLYPVRVDGADFLVPLAHGQELNEASDNSLVLCTAREEYAFHRAEPAQR